MICRKRCQRGGIGAAPHVWATNSPVTLSQENISIIANTSRKQVNNIIQRFVEEGWIGAGYRSITVTNPVALWQHAEQDIDN